MLNLDSIKKRLDEFKKNPPDPHPCEMCGFMPPCVCESWDEIRVHDAQLDKQMDEDNSI